MKRTLLTELTRLSSKVVVGEFKLLLIEEVEVCFKSELQSTVILHDFFRSRCDTYSIPTGRTRQHLAYRPIPSPRYSSWFRMDSR